MTDEDRQKYTAGYRQALEHAALAYASTCGDLDAEERAELLSLRRLRDLVVSVRNEIANEMATGVDPAVALFVETIDAGIALSLTPIGKAP